MKSWFMGWKPYAAIVLGVLMLSGCAATIVQDALEIELPDGRTVPCVFSDGGGVDCDWGSAE